MNFILFIFLCGVFHPEISGTDPTDEGPEMTPLPEQPVAEQPHKVEEENKENTPANEKTGNYYKDTKQYVFTTQNPNGTQSEISVRATTDLKFSLRNYKLVNETTTLPPPETVSNEEESKEPIEKTIHSIK
uniref:Uncharacterized protein n=1 Tax=Balaenoptera musculus TaxID=9771 RepID=A0A8C0CCT5_BALMU